MSGPPLNHLRVFCSIVECGSIAAAARQLSLAPPSVSATLRALETSLGVTLFVRTTRRIRLTGAGKQLYDQVSRPLADIRGAITAVQSHREQPVGTLRITLPRFAWQWLVRPMYPAFCRQYPDVELELHLFDGMVDMQREGFDLGIRFGEKVEPGKVARRLTPPIRDAVFASPAFLARHGMPDSLDALEALPLIHYRFWGSNRLAPLQLQDDDGALREVHPPRALIVNDTEAMVDAALNGMGVGRIAEPVVVDALRSGQLVPIMEGRWLKLEGLFAHYLPALRHEPRIRAFLDCLMKATASQSAT